MASDDVQNHVRWHKFISHLQEQGVELCLTKEPPPGLENRVPYLRRVVDGATLTSALPQSYDPEGLANAFTVSAICRRLQATAPYIKLVL